MRLFALGASFLFAVAAARLLGPSGYGIVAVALSIGTVVATIALLGIDGLAVREVATLATRREWGELKRFVRWASQTVLGFSVLAALLVAVTSLFAGRYSDALLLSSATVPLLAGLMLLKSTIQGLGRMVEAQAPNEVLRWVLSLGLIAILLINEVQSPAAVMVAVIAALTISALVSAWVLRRLLARYPNDCLTAVSPRRWINQASSFLAVAFFGIVGTEMSTLLLGWLAGPREAGLYQPIAKLAPVMLLAAYSIETALAPKIVQNWEEEDRVGLQRLMRRSAKASTLATAVLVSAILIGSPAILQAFGQEFTAYQSYLYWIGAAQLANSAFGSSPLLLAMVGDMSSRLRAQAATLVVQSALAIALIPTMGAAGAVISLTAAILTWAAVHWWFAWRATGINSFAFATMGRLRETDNS